MTAKKSIFKTNFARTSDPADPEALFLNLRGRVPEIRHLWSHQADLLRAYYQEPFAKFGIGHDIGLATVMFRR